MGSQDGTAQGVAAKLEQHSHFGELHAMPTATFTDAIGCGQKWLIYGLGGSSKENLNSH